MLNSSPNRLQHALDYSVTKQLKPLKPRGVYVFECQGFYKIGFASDPHRRLKESQTGNPYVIRLLMFKQVMDAPKQEGWLHEQLSQYHVRGEWFKLPYEEVVRVVTALSSL